MGGDILGTATRNCCGVLDNPLVGQMSVECRRSSMPPTLFRALNTASKGSAYGTPLTYYANDVPILRTIIPALRTLYRQSEKQR
jgi:hypothetical protein